MCRILDFPFTLFTFDSKRLKIIIYVYIHISICMCKTLPYICYKSHLFSYDKQPLSIGSLRRA